MFSWNQLNMLFTVKHLDSLSAQLMMFHTKMYCVPPTMLRSVGAVRLTGCNKPQVELLFMWFTSDHHVPGTFTFHALTSNNSPQQVYVTEKALKQRVRAKTCGSKAVNDFLTVTQVQTESDRWAPGRLVTFRFLPLSVMLHSHTV